MSKKIEIYENTLLKLLVRRGIDLDRKNVILSEGELGYTTDLKRLYVGDGQTPGGILVGGSSAFPSTNTITTLSNVVSGDIVYSPSSRTLYRFKGGQNNELADWEVIGGTYISNDGTINITQANTISVGLISANNISPNAVGSGLRIDNEGKISVNSDNVIIGKITPRQGESLELPGDLVINNTTYSWPQNAALQNDLYLTTDTGGNLTWDKLEATQPVLLMNPNSQMPVGSIMPYISTNSVPQGWLLCNGQQVLKLEFPDLFDALGPTYDLGTEYFTVPNFVNKTLYGIQSNGSPTSLFGSTTGSSTLSATGVFFVIKAIPDEVASSTITVRSPLSCVVDGRDLTGNAISPLSGNITITYTPPEPLIGSTGFRNKVINGNFDFWQRGTSTGYVDVATAAGLSKLADRWVSNATGLNSASYSVTRQMCTETELSAFNANYYQRLTYRNGVGAYNALYGGNSYEVVDNDNSRGVIVIQNIENASSILGKPMTLTFWARASQPTKIFSEMQIHSNDSSFATPTINAIFDLTTSWQKFKHTYIAPTFEQVSAVAYNPNNVFSNGGTTSAPNYTPLGSINSLPALSSWIYQVDIKTHWTKRSAIRHGNAWNGSTSLRPGSAVNFPGTAMTLSELRDINTSVLSSAGGGWYDIAQIQLEEGNTPTEFEFRPAGLEFELCRRYYEIGGILSPDPKGSHSRHHLCTPSRETHAGWQFAVGKCRVPTVTFWRPSLGKSASTGFIETYEEINQIGVSNITSNIDGVTYFNTAVPVNPGVYTGGLMQIGWEADAEI